MKSRTRALLLWCLGPLAIGMVTPSAVIWYLEVFVVGLDPLAAAGGIAALQFAEGHNLFLLAVFGLIPFAVLSMTCLIASRWLATWRVGWLSVCGLAGILGVMIPAHLAVWNPLYSGGGFSSTAVIAFVFIPFYCLVPLCVGLVVGWCVPLLRLMWQPTVPVAG